MHFFYLCCFQLMTFTTILKALMSPSITLQTIKNILNYSMQAI
jgi:hypothetical protein